MSATDTQKVIFYFYNNIPLCVKHTKQTIVFTELNEFRIISQRFTAITESIATKVDAAKMQAIGAQTLLQAKVNQRETEQKDIQVKHFGMQYKYHEQWLNVTTDGIA